MKSVATALLCFIFSTVHAVDLRQTSREIRRATQKEWTWFFDHVIGADTLDSQNSMDRGLDYAGVFKKANLWFDQTLFPHLPDRFNDPFLSLENGKVIMNFKNTALLDKRGKPVTPRESGPKFSHDWTYKVVWENKSMKLLEKKHTKTRIEG